MSDYHAGDGILIWFEQISKYYDHIVVRITDLLFVYISNAIIMLFISRLENGKSQYGTGCLRGWLNCTLHPSVGFTFCISSASACLRRPSRALQLFSRLDASLTLDFKWATSASKSFFLFSADCTAAYFLSSFLYCKIPFNLFKLCNVYVYVTATILPYLCGSFFGSRCFYDRKWDPSWRHRYSTR